jgi:hypothetical protein
MRTQVGFVHILFVFVAYIFINMKTTRMSSFKIRICYTPSKQSKIKAHTIGSYGINNYKVSLSCFDNKRYILEDGKMGNAIMRIRDALLGMCIRDEYVIQTPHK